MRKKQVEDFLDSNFLIYLNAMTSDERRRFDEFFMKLLKEQLFINMLIINEVLYIYQESMGFHMRLH
ncbi:MAG: hypothetical protein QW487_02285 [Candidatus Bathyarchaeia archaeon]